MKKRTVITTEKFEVWIVPEVPAGTRKTPGTETSESESTNEPVPLAEEHQETKKLPRQEIDSSHG